MIVYFWSFITWPFYFIYYGPWKRTRNFKRKRATQIDIKTDEVTYRAKPRLSHLRTILKNHEANIRTMDKVWKYAAQQFAKKRCLGTRKIIEEKKVDGPNGKKFTKLVMDSQYQWTNYEDIYHQSTYVGRGLQMLGMKSRDKLVMYCDTKAEWMITAVGCFKFNFTLVTIYTNLGAEGVIYGINQTEANYICTSQELLPKLMNVLDKLPHVKTIIVIEEPWKGELELLDSKFENMKTMYTWQTVFDSGKQNRSIEPNAPMPEDIAILMYTSGSTGNPKGVMITHGNMVNALFSLVGLAEGTVGSVQDDDSYIGYLPLAHVLELLAESTMLIMGIGIGYSSPNSLTDTSTMVMPGAKGDASILKPTVMTAVPVILDKIYKGINANIQKAGPFSAKLIDFCVRYRGDWVRRGYDTPIINKFVFSKLRNIVGGRVRVMLSGGAPLAEEAHQFIRTALCCCLHQGYGLTETTSTAAITEEDDISLGRVGAPLQGVDIKLVSWNEGNYSVTDSVGPRGEIHIGGHHVAAGYYNMPEKTDEEFYDQGGKRWFKTGDIGHALPDGTFKIIDRKKDLVKLQMGEYVSLGKVESILKIHIVVDNVCVCARPTDSFTTALVVPDETKLKLLASELLVNQDLSHEELCQDPKVVNEVLKQLTSHGLSMGCEKFEVPKAITLIPELWTPDSGLVTAAMKLKRKEIENRYCNQIDLMYSGKNSTNLNKITKDQPVKMSQIAPA